MTLEFELFHKFAQEFLSLSASLGDDWVMKPIGTDKRDIYLEKRSTVHDGSKYQSAGSNDSSAMLQNTFIVFVYHIIYSQSYSVPVLYFNAYYADGKLLTLEEIWKRIPNCYQNSVENNKWNMLTQQEHPKLGLPYYMIHPCYTANFMSSCNKSNYIITWLSIVGPVVGLQLSCEYAKCLKINKIDDT